MIDSLRQDSQNMTNLAARIVGRSGTRDTTVAVAQLIIAGWTARNAAAMEHHIAELEALGVARPAETPTFYCVAHSRLSQAARIDVAGEATSGELEFVLVESGGEHYVGIGSDHTDRELEKVGVTVSKQVCDKPVGHEFWPLAEVADHWDDLVLRAHVVIDGERHLYQEGSFAEMLQPDDLIRRFNSKGGLPANCAMFGGTLPAIGGVRPADRFEGEIEDPVLGRTLTLSYDVMCLPVRG
jgi:hypothetical protein